jgi:hypothetical protein
MRFNRVIRFAGFRRRVSHSSVTLGQGRHGADMPMAMIGITVDQSEVPSGEVTFRVTNDFK